MKKMYLEMPSEHLIHLIELIGRYESEEKSIDDLVDKFFEATESSYTFCGMTEKTANNFVTELSLALSFQRQLNQIEEILPKGFSIERKKNNLADSEN